MENSDSKTEKKEPMTHEERLALASKLDEELDDFIAGLEKRKYTEGWPEDKWQEEMEKHPFFMTKLPENDELPPLLEGIQQLKFDENENTPLELAKSYKEDGNFNFKHKKYRMAVLSYTEGIRRHCGNAEIEAQLYNNRAAAQFRLENYRSSLSDCQQALKIQPDYVKAKLKAAQCCAKLKMCTEAINYFNEILEKEPEEPTALKMHSEVVAIKKEQDRDNRKQKRQDKELQAKLQSLKTALESRNIQLEVDRDIVESLELSSEKPVLENGELSWPVLFFYPEYSVSDYIEQFHENSTFFTHLSNMFSEPPHWDTAKEYQPEKLAVYYESFNGSELCPVDVHQTLLEVLTCETFVVQNWKPSFFILVKGSSAESKFLEKYNSSYIF